MKGNIIVVGMFLLALIFIISTDYRQHSPKNLELPEEFPLIQKGDTLVKREYQDSVIIYFYKGEILTPDERLLIVK